MTQQALLLHVHFDLIQRHMSRTFDHHLYILFPGPFGQRTQNAQFGKLRSIGGIMQATRAQTIAQRQGHVIAGADFQQTVKMGKEWIFLLMIQHPLRHQSPATGDNFGDA